jgi:hypothetical protein
MIIRGPDPVHETVVSHSRTYQPAQAIEALDPLCVKAGQVDTSITPMPGWQRRSLIEKNIVPAMGRLKIRVRVVMFLQPSVRISDAFEAPHPIITVSSGAVG